MRWTKLSLSAALCMCSPWAAVAQETYPPELVGPGDSGVVQFVGDGVQHIGDAVHNIGDSVQFVGDDPMATEMTTPVVQPAPALLRKPANAPQLLVGDLVSNREVSEPSSASDTAPVIISSSDSLPCDTCEGSSRVGGSCGMQKTHRKWWGEFDTLLWWGREFNLPPLVTTAPNGQLPILGLPGTEVLYGGPTAADPQIGLRFDLGRYCGDCEETGVGFRLTYLGSLNAPFSTFSNGSTPLGIPYFETQTGSQSVIELAGGSPGTGFNEGLVQANDEVDFVSVEPYLRFRMCEISNVKIDLIGGYTYQQLKNDFTLLSATGNFTTGDLIPDNGTIYGDGFYSTNQFNGGHFGWQSRLQRRRLTFEHMFKMHLGNMHQDVEITGASLTVAPNTPPVVGEGGIFALPSNIGNYERDQFTFIPEINLKLGYALSRHWTATIGYSFLYFDNVALSGDLIDTQIDGLQQAGVSAGTYPQFSWADSSYWLQGIDFGIQYNW